MEHDDAHRLISACFSSRDDAVALLCKEPQLLLARTRLGETPLHHLSVENQLESAQLLVEHGAEVNTLNECGGTPLSEAASLGYAELVAYLLSQGAQLHLPGQREATLHEAVRGGNAAIVSMLLATGAAIDAANDLDETALHIASETDERIEVLHLLLVAGANIHASRIFDETPLDVADANGSVKIVDALLARGATRARRNAMAP